MTTVRVMNASEAYRERSISALVAAFISDPFIRWMLPEPGQYFAYFPQVLKFFAGRAFDNQSAYCSKDFKGTALWLPPGVSPDEKALVEVIEEGVDGNLLEEVFAVLEQVDKSHPQEEYWYLPVIGVDPICQGRGYGSALLSHCLKVCDHGHVAACLEATNPASIHLYKRFGFQVMGEIQVGSSPTITPMFRASQ